MSTLVRFDPWSTWRDFDRAFMSAGTQATTWMPRVDVFEADGAITVRAELPGVDADSVEVTHEGRVLTLSGSRHLTSEDFSGTMYRREILDGEFERKIRLPQGVDGESITATFTDGLLEVVVPLLPEVQPRKVTVTTQR